MPLMKGPSKKAFKHNVEVEMRAHPDKRAQDLAIAYSVQRKAKHKKMAGGGMVNESAASEHRPMPEERDKDAKMVNHNSGKKPLVDADWTGRLTVMQAQKPSKTPLSRPKIAKGSTFSSIDRDLMDQEERLQSAMPPSSPKDQPKSEYNEDSADRQGPKVPDMQREHNNGRKPYFEGGVVSEKASEEDGVEHPAGLEEDDDQMRPAMDDYMSGHEQMLAEGGMAHEMDMQPEPEEEMEHHDSLASAVMARMKKASQHSNSSIDHEMYMADGGMVDLQDNNGDEQPNHEDDYSYDAIRKKTYFDDSQLGPQPMDSNEHGDEHEMESSDPHDMISKIRSKMKRKQF